MMIQEAIINELQYIPEAKLVELYDLIHYFRLGLNSEKQLVDDEVKIDPELCLQTLAKLKQGDFSSFTEIENIEFHIQSLRNEISHESKHLETEI